jgi:kynurenine--oxoglutarate transaminase/cysteine-S-conjugate beta-lyase/glutamine--phenylpyruvate transaminase
MALARLGRPALRGPQVGCMPLRSVSSRAAPGGADRTKNFGVSVFSEFTPLAQAHKAVNLGQGFPDFEAPAFVISAAQEALGKHLNQYTRSMGHLRLVNALATFYAPKFGRNLSALTDVVVTAGATEAIFTSMQALINPGDEVPSVAPECAQPSP